MRRELRVFPRRTSYTPTDALVAIGEPGLFRPENVAQVSVSCVFTWEMEYCRHLAKAWEAYYPHARVELGGPATGEAGGGFTPGRFVKEGVSISSRGCPENCPWCLVREREGKLRLLPIAEGWIVNDNNVTAFPRAHWEKLCAMLQRQPRGAVFAGGIQASRVKDWHVESLRSMRVNRLFFAADHMGAIPALRKAARAVALGIEKMRCYVLMGFKGETIGQATERLEAVWDAGCMPFPQLYRDPANEVTHGREWHQLVKRWSRPAIVKAMHKGEQ